MNSTLALFTFADDERHELPPCSFAHYCQFNPITYPKYSIPRMTMSQPPDSASALPSVQDWQKRSNNYALKDPPIFTIVDKYRPTSSSLSTPQISYMLLS